MSEFGNSTKYTKNMSNQIWISIGLNVSGWHGYRQKSISKFFAKILLVKFILFTCYTQANENIPKPKIINQAINFNDSQIRRENEREIVNEREKTLQEELVILTNSVVENKNLVSDETVEDLCFPISRVNVRVPQSLQDQESVIPEELEFVKAVAATYKDRCININELNKITLDLLKHTTARGYTTTRFFIPEQDLRTEELKINMVPGRLNKIIISGQNSQRLAKTIFSYTPGQILNVREIERGLEQLKRLHNIKSNISLTPTFDQTGYTDVVVNIDEGKFWQSFLSTDNSGTDATGDVITRINTSFANLTGMAEKITLGISKDSNDDKNIDQQSFSVGVDMPFKYISAQYTHSGSAYSQYIGIDDAAVSSGESQSDSISINTEIYRDQSNKLSSKFIIAHTTGRSFINDTEIEIQKKKRTTATLNLAWKKFYGSQIYNFSYSAKQGTPWFGAQEDALGKDSLTPTYEYLIHTIDISVIAPIKIIGLNANYLGVIRGQYTDNRVYASEFFSIGSRYSVRGFGDEIVLSSEGGFYSQNEISIQTKNRLLQPYFGLDAGLISGPSQKNALGDHLVGGFMGLKGAWKDLSYNLFYAQGIESPTEFEVKGSTIGASFNYVFK